MDDDPDQGMSSLERGMMIRKAARHNAKRLGDGCEPVDIYIEDEELRNVDAALRTLPFEQD